MRFYLTDETNMGPNQMVSCYTVISIVPIYFIVAILRQGPTVYIKCLVRKLGVT